MVLVRKILFLSIWFLLSSPAYPRDAADLDQTLDRLLYSGNNFSSFGSVCEELAKERLNERFDSQDFMIHLGVTYRDRHRILGELDVVVERVWDQEIILVAEVKCWKNLVKARQKALSQLSRFREILDTNDLVQLDHKNGDFILDQFDDLVEYMTVGQRGSVAHGFDREIDYDLEDVMYLFETLRDMLEP